MPPGCWRSNLGDGAEAENLRVFDLPHVVKAVRHQRERVSNKLVQTRQCVRSDATRVSQRVEHERERTKRRVNGENITWGINAARTLREKMTWAHQIWRYTEILTHTMLSSQDYENSYLVPGILKDHPSLGPPVQTKGTHV